MPPHHIWASRVRREQARAQLAALGASSEGIARDVVAGAQPAGASESDLSLARAMLTRASRALEKLASEGGEGGERGEDARGAARDRIETARARLVAAVEQRAARTGELTDELSDALLDLL